MNAVLKADCRYLRIECEISSHCGRFAHAAKNLGVTFAGKQQANRRASEQAFDKGERNP
jgi:hypothetical protein